MNKTKIEYAHRTWNPVVGCTHGCPWCYARRMCKRNLFDCPDCRAFRPHLHPERLCEPQTVKTPCRILTCSMGDVFDPALTVAEICAVLEGMMVWNQHTYMVLTKNPSRIVPVLDAFCRHTDLPLEGDPWDRLRNVWWGTSCSDCGDADRVLDLLQVLDRSEDAVLWTSLEPIMGPVSDVIDPRLSWVVMGGLTGPGAKGYEPVPSWVSDAISICIGFGIPMYMKDNLHREDPRREFPSFNLEGGRA